MTALVLLCPCGEVWHAPAAEVLLVHQSDRTTATATHSCGAVKTTTVASWQAMQLLLAGAHAVLRSPELDSPERHAATPLSEAWITTAVDMMTVLDDVWGDLARVEAQRRANKRALLDRLRSVEDDEWL